MGDDALIADVQSTRELWTGAGLLESTQGVVEAIMSENWVDAGLGGVGWGLEMVGSMMDPFSALLSNGLGWAMEYFEPMREALDWVSGQPDLVTSHATTWYNMSDELYSIWEELGAALSQDLPGWTGEAAEGYRALMGHNLEAVGGLSGTASAMGAAAQGACGLMVMTRELIREFIADCVGKAIVWAIEAMGVYTAPAIAVGIVGAVIEWCGTIFGWVTALVASYQNLKLLLDL
ncbi:hypothetical protein LO763_05595 [Glycomyces sp. A-F 0318]|uniref:WXG100 family type VII secretion target n=1 Tax=Glycomyces amatae TaxID=2881355 RepID=UPI001E5FE8BF|nr:hypothetical protein [Glycomyces amatae]MCD0443101.1 hypothetical protein [Glycomyces amatae]